MINIKYSYHLAMYYRQYEELKDSGYDASDEDIKREAVKLILTVTLFIEVLDPRDENIMNPLTTRCSQNLTEKNMEP